MNDRQQQVPVRKLRAKARALAGSQEFGVSSNKNEQVGLRLQIVGGELDGQMVTWYGTFSPAAEERTIEQLQIAGWNGEDFANLPGLGSTEVEVQLEEYEGQDQETGEHFLWHKAAWINRIGVTMKNAMNAGEKASFAQRMQAKYGKGGQQAAPRGSQQRTNGTQRRSYGGAQQETPDYTDEDIPL